MARPVRIEEKAILTAAREIFLEHGPSATTAQVADRAGVSEGTLFHRFGSKAELFATAIQVHGEDWSAQLAPRVGHGQIRQQLVGAGLDGIAFFGRIMPLATLAWSEPATRKHGQARRGHVPPPVRGVQALAAYFRAEMAAGRLRKQSPDVTARAFAGALWNFVWMRMMFGSAATGVVTDRRFVTDLVLLLWQGLDPARSRGKQPIRGEIR